MRYVSASHTVQRPKCAITRYHNDKSTIEVSRQQRAEFIAQHRDKWLSPWPEQVRAEVDSYIDQNLDLIYGHIRFREGEPMEEPKQP